VKKIVSLSRAVCKLDIFKRVQLRIIGIKSMKEKYKDACVDIRYNNTTGNGA